MEARVVVAVRWDMLLRRFIAPVVWGDRVLPRQLGLVEVGLRMDQFRRTLVVVADMDMGMAIVGHVGTDMAGWVRLDGLGRGI
jgi:hypothetical protein